MAESIAGKVECQETLMATVRPEAAAVAPPLLTDEAISQLRRAVKGDVLQPGQPGFEAEKDGFERAVVHHPALVVAARGHEDVAAAVQWAAEQGLGVAVQATGHGPGAPADASAILVTTSRMTSVDIDTKARTARVDAGARWSDVIEAAARHGLVPLSGAAPAVSAVGYLLGGGLGLLSRRFGSPADQIHSLSVVTADGRTVEASLAAHPELFWGLRGSRGNFGVVTSATIGLFPLDLFAGGSLFFDGEHLRAVLDAWTAWTATVPDAMCSSLAVLRFPPLPQVPEFLRGRHAVHVRIAFTGSEEEARSLLAPLTSAAPLLADTTAAMPYSRSGAIHADSTNPAATVSRTMLLGELDEAAVDTLERLGERDDAGPLLFELRHLQGALAHPVENGGAVGARPDAVFSLFSLAVLVPGVDGAEVVARHFQSDVEKALTPWAVPGAEPNFVVGPRTEEQVREVYGTRTYRKLSALKTRYDPANMFRYNLNIRPETQIH
ncbi:FAD-binding oxidoreductase [Streptomyces sp. NPDC048409]|uniref:FAD-binding oxidoreductase n=1 Tax=Streptomyces sp. NPDC048409 TaxID=3154723 RepID=UPI00342B042B